MTSVTHSRCAYHHPQTFNIPPCPVNPLITIYSQGYHHPVPTIIDRIPPGTLRRYTNAFGPKLDTWTFADRVVLIGDAAHAHGGAFGAGASLAIDDAYTLYLALRAVFPQALPISRPIPRSHIGLALDLYESVRRPHAARVLDIVLQDRQKQFARNEGLKAAGKEESDQDFRERMKGRKGAAWLHEHNVEKAFQEAITRRFSSGEQNGHGKP